MQKNFTFLLCLILFALLPMQAQYQLNGSAIQTDEDCFQLTPALNTQAGSVWYLEQINLLESFTLDFDIFLGCVDANGADGMYFVLQPISTSLGNLGGGMGFEGIVPSLGVEFDTWQNTNYNDPTFDHVAIQQNGNLNHVGIGNLAGPIPVSATSNNVEDCVNHNMRITWNAASLTLSVYFDCNLRLTYTGDIVNNIFGGNPFVFWGFTSATGAANNVHAVCLDYISFTDQLEDVSICPGESVPLSVPAGFELYIWEPATGLTDPNSPSTIATPTQTTTYSVTVIDECGNDFTDTVTITVITPPDAPDLGEDGFICESQTILLDATTPGATGYLWNTGSTNPVLEVAESGAYWVLVNNACGFAADTITFLPLVVDLLLDLGADVAICEGEVATLTPNILGDAFNYLWSNGQTTPSIAVAQAGVYTLTVSNNCGLSIDTIAVSVTPAPTVDLGAPLQDLCAEDLNLLNAFTPDATGYIWQDGSNASAYQVQETGIYSVTVSNTCGAASDEVCITLQSCDALCQSMAVTHVYTCNAVTLNYLVYASVAGGVAPYTVSGSYSGVINQDNSVISFELNGAATNYNLTFTDAAGCVRSVLVKPFCNTLPVALLNFTGATLERYNQLQWQVASETNCAYYTLYHSPDAQNFTPIAQVTAKGNTSLQQQYQYLHANPPGGKSYYRLTQTDFDGATQILGTVLLQRLFAGNTALLIETIAPVPAKSEAWLTFTLPDAQPVYLTLFDTAGKMITQQLLSAQAGNNQAIVPVNTLPAGLYFVRLHNHAGSSVVKLVKE